MLNVSLILKLTRAALQAIDRLDVPGVEEALREALTLVVSHRRGYPVRIWVEPATPAKAVVVEPHRGVTS
jgi:hypothetical protein